MILRKWIGVVVLFAFVFSQSLHAQKIDWVSMTEGLKRAEAEQKKIFIDMYTKWCTWCKKMDQATFQQPDIAAYINANFIPVKFDAEDRTPIDYKGQTYEFVNTGRRGYHELAAELSKNLGRLSYPTIIFLDEELDVIQPIPGFQDPKTFELIMYYIGGDHFRKTPYRSFAANFVSKRE